MQSEIGELETTYLKSGRTRYQLVVRHSGLHKIQTVTGENKHVVQQKAKTLKSRWDQTWEEKLGKERKVLSVKENKSKAARRTEQAEQSLNELENILKQSLSVNVALDWESLKSASEYPVSPPTHPNLPPEPNKTDEKYDPRLGMVDKLFSSRRIEKEQKAEQLFQADLKKWVEYKEKVEAKYATEYAEWENAKTIYYQEQEATNSAVEQQKQDYLRGNGAEAIVGYCDLVLATSSYPDYFPQSYELHYNLETRMLIVDYQLPSIDELPTLKEVKYIQTRDEFAEKHLPQTQINRLYDNLLYQVALRTNHELYGADRINALASIVFNGFVDSIDPATGRQNNSCILSLQTKKEEFESINLSKVDPKACFKSLKGIGAARLYSLTPVAPILKIDREDSRFVASYDVAEVIEGENLASMDWEDFEHLIRELFEKEFASHGGEVKVTRASRDGGIDAVVFDPDPIRGGKIVIQAKRYTNTVGVSAVRDLYGTLINEGANKGILVTTSDYGADAHEFAKGKPVVLLSGAQLLYLLEKHGHQARIDLKEAKQILLERQRT